MPIVVVRVVVNLGFTTLLTSQVISVAFYSARVNSNKFCSEALISAWGSFTCRKSTTRDPRRYFPSEGSLLRIFTLWKNQSTPTGFEPANHGSNGEYDNHGTTGVDAVVVVVEVQEHCYTSSTQRWSLNKCASEKRNIEEVRYKIKVSNHSETWLVRFWQKPNQGIAMETSLRCQTGTWKTR